MGVGCSLALSQKKQLCNSVRVANQKWQPQLTRSSAPDIVSQLARLCQEGFWWWLAGSDPRRHTFQPKCMSLRSSNRFIVKMHMPHNRSNVLASIGR